MPGCRPSSQVFPPRETVSYISHRIKLTLYKVIVQSTLLYGCETWAIPDANVKNLELFQMKCLRRLCGISLMDKISNVRIRAMCKVPQIANLFKPTQI
jgi:hypothetical protein